MPVVGYRRSTMMSGKGKLTVMNGQSVKVMTATKKFNFRVEHIASFPIQAGDKLVSAQDRLRKAKELITKNEPWTKEMDLTVTDKEVVFLDCETQEFIERYPLLNVDSVQEIDNDPLLKSVLVFSTTQTNEKYAAVHLFQCDKVPASIIGPEIRKLIAEQGGKVTSSSKSNGMVLPPPPQQPAPSPPSSVGEVYTSAVSSRNNVQRPAQSTTKINYDEKYNDMSSPELMEAYINRDVQVLNHCIDDVEELVYRVKQVAESWKNLEAKYRGKKSKAKKQEAEEIEKRSPSREDFIDAFQKCKFSFRLLGKLRSHIQNPSAAELVHYLIMPLSLLVRCTRGPREASGVIHPLLSSESIELLRTTLTENETELWKSLGPAWTLASGSPHWSNTPVEEYEPKFRSGWHPSEIIGSGRSVPAGLAAQAANAARIKDGSEEIKVESKAKTLEEKTYVSVPTSVSTSLPNSIPSSPAKEAIFKRVKAVYSFTAQHPKELTINQGEELMILDDSRQWWCVRNSRGAVGFVPNTVLKNSGSMGSSNRSQSSPRMVHSNGHHRRTGSSSSESSNAVFPSNHSSSSLDGHRYVKPPSPNINGGSIHGSNFEKMIQNRVLKKVEDVPDGGAPVEPKRLSSVDLLNNELKDKIRSPVHLRQSSQEQESAILLSKQSTAHDVQNWMKAKNFSNEAMAAVQTLSAHELSVMSSHDISHLVGRQEGQELYRQINIAKSGDCWQHIVVHPSVSELQAVMDRRKNISEGNVEGGQIRDIVKSAQSDRHDTYYERKLQKRGSLENLSKDFMDRQASEANKMNRQTSYELRKRPDSAAPIVQPPPPPSMPPPPPSMPAPPPSMPPPVKASPPPVKTGPPQMKAPRPPPTKAPPPPVSSKPVPPVAPKPRPANGAQYVGVIPPPVVNNPKMDDLLREHQKQQKLLKEQEEQLAQLRLQQKQNEEMSKYQADRIRLEQQVKDQEVLLRMLQEQQKQTIPPPTGTMHAAAIPTAIPATATMPPQPYLSYMPMPSYPQIAMPGVQSIPQAQPFYTIPQVYQPVYQPK